MNLTALPALNDNYIWMLDDGHRAIIVDPGESAPVVAALDARGLALAAILVTHHHQDHCGGVDALRPRLQGEVYGPAREQIPQPAVGLGDGDRIEVLGLRFDVIDIPGHTAGHIAFHHSADAVDAGVLFCGDTLFSAGCGRLFEGTPAQMHRSLSRLAELPGDTRVCCGHEYTLANLKFAHAVEPANADVKRYVEWCRTQRAAGLATLPSTLEREARVNPFLRVGVPEVVNAAQRHGAVDPGGTSVLAALRTWKNDFR